MKYSKQRNLILDTVIMNKIHPTADDIYVMLKPTNESLSLGTVYRNLNLLSENGTIKKLSMPNASDRFDGNTLEHYHIVCDNCNKVVDINISIKDKLNAEIEKQTGITVQSYQLVANGICDKCKKNFEGEKI